MSANTPRYELCGGNGRYWARFVIGRNVIWSNHEQGYGRKRDALRSIEVSLLRVGVLRGNGPWPTSVRLLGHPRTHSASWVEVRDCTDRALAAKEAAK